MEPANYYLMNKNRPLTIIQFTQMGDIIDYSREYKNREYLPIVAENDDNWLHLWWGERKVPLTRNNLKNLLTSKGYTIPEQYLYKNLGLSLTDCYWIKPVDSNLKWEDVNLFSNPFKDNTLKWDDNKSNEITGYSPNSSLKGNVEKTWTARGKERFLIKGNTKETSTQSINEVLASHIHKKQKHDNYTKYKLTYIKGKPYDYGCSCKLFTDENTELVSAYDLILSEPRKGTYYEHLLTVCEHKGMDAEKIREELEYQILTDYIMSQTDRHFNNIGFLRDTETLEFIGTAPIFDSGDSMYANTTAPVNERDMSHLFTHGFENDISAMLKLVNNPGLIDLSKLPSASEIKEMYEKDSKDTETHINGMVYAYEKRIDLCRKFQLGKI